MYSLRTFNEPRHANRLLIVLQIVKLKLVCESMQSCYSFSFMQVFLSGFIHTLKCLSIGTPKIINFPFVSNGKLMVFRCPNIHAHCNETVLCLIWGHLKIMNFPFGINGKFIIFRCPNT